MNHIEITESNYRDYMSLDIVAFSFAHGGAMGEPGGIVIIDRNGTRYHANYCYGNDHLQPDHIKDIIPDFEDIDWKQIHNEPYHGDWYFVYLGYGNNLLMRKEISEGFKQKVEAAHFEHSGELYQQWPGFVLGLLGNGDPDLTMDDIYDEQKQSRRLNR